MSKIFLRFRAIYMISVGRQAFVSWLSNWCPFFKLRDVLAQNFRHLLGGYLAFREHDPLVRGFWDRFLLGYGRLIFLEYPISMSCNLKLQTIHGGQPTLTSI